MRNKIKNHYESEFSSSPVEITEEEIDFIIEKDCQCEYCGKSIFEMNDFPELLECSELMCEECYGDHHRETCSICEESYDTRNLELMVKIDIEKYKSENHGDGISGEICPDCVKKFRGENVY